MIFTYKYLDTEIERLQESLDHLFLNVWCRADSRVQYDVSLLSPLLQNIVNEIFYDATKPYAEYLYGPIEIVYKMFQGLDKDTKHRLAWMYLENNCIEILCNKEDGFVGHTYIDLDAYCFGLGDILKNFYEKLYTDVLGLQVIKSSVGDLEDHYDEFVKINSEDKCPFCGINSIKGIYNSKREAYDHYLPKAVYPFNSVNFRNLAPMCHECNSSYKLAKDPIRASAKKNPLINSLNLRRKAFYVYSDKTIDLGFSLTISNTDLNSLSPADINLSFDNDEFKEEIDTWKDVFGIEERYRAVCLSKNGGRYWFEQAVDEYANTQVDLGVQFTREKWVDHLVKAAKRKPHADANFIKAEFLEAFRAYLIR